MEMERGRSFTEVFCDLVFTLTKYVYVYIYVCMCTLHYVHRACQGKDKAGKVRNEPGRIFAKGITRGVANKVK